VTTDDSQVTNCIQIINKRNNIFINHATIQKFTGYRLTVNHDFLKSDKCMLP